MPFYGLLFPSTGIHLFTNWTCPESSSSTYLWHCLVCVIFLFIWLILVLFLSLFCHPTHPYLLLPHLIFHNSESAYSFYIYLPLCQLLGYGLCARPALNLYVYKHLVSGVSIPQTWNQPGSHYCLSSLQQPWGCFCWLLNYALDLLTYCVSMALRRKLAQ